MMNEKEKEYYNAVEPLYKAAIFREGYRLNLDVNETVSMYHSNIGNHQAIIMNMMIIAPLKKEKTWYQKFKRGFKK